MRTETDQLAKRILAEALADAGETIIEQEVCAPDPQRIDLWHVPGPREVDPPRRLRLLLQMAERPCLLEPFSRPPGLPQLRQNQRKQLVWHHRLSLDAKRPEGPPPLPFLWLLSPGRPEALFSACDLVPLAGWPAGFYHFGRPWEIGLLVVAELPRGAETIILRLLGSDRVRREALTDLGLLEDPKEAQALREFVVGLRQSILRDKDVNSDEREAFMTAVQAELQKFKQEIRDEGVEKGIEKGIEKGMSQSILAFLAARGIPVGEESRAQILSCTERARLQRWIARAATVTSAADLLADP